MRSKNYWSLQKEALKNIKQLFETKWFKKPPPAILDEGNILRVLTYIFVLVSKILLWNAFRNIEFEMMGQDLQESLVNFERLRRFLSDSF